MAENIKRLPWIDVLRAVAVLSVLLVHTSQYGSGSAGLPKGMTAIIAEGAKGVQLFFVISAYTILLTYLKHKKREIRATSNFFIRRIFRIGPMFYIAMVYYLLQDGFGPRYWLGDAPGISRMNIAATAMFINGINPYWMNSIVPGGWSITVEFSFYLLIPVIVRIANNFDRATIALYVSLVIKAVFSIFLYRYQLIASETLWDEYLFLYLPNQLPVFMLGIVLYYYLTEEMHNASGKIFVIVAPLLLFNRISVPYIDVGLAMWGLLFFGMAVLLFLYLKNSQLIMILAYVGKISYSMYLVHFAVLHWFDKLHFLDFFHRSNEYLAILNFTVRYILVCIVTVLFSSLTYLWIEKPIITLGNDLVRKRELRVLATTTQKL